MSPKSKEAHAMTTLKVEAGTRGKSNSDSLPQTTCITPLIGVSRTIMPSGYFSISANTLETQNKAIPQNLIVTPSYPEREKGSRIAPIAPNNRRTTM
jgi:hypothetical protein